MLLKKLYLQSVLERGSKVGGQVLLCFLKVKLFSMHVLQQWEEYCTSSPRPSDIPEPILYLSFLTDKRQGVIKPKPQKSLTQTPNSLMIISRFLVYFFCLFCFGDYFSCGGFFVVVILCFHFGFACSFTIGVFFWVFFLGGPGFINNQS